MIVVSTTRRDGRRAASVDLANLSAGNASVARRQADGRGATLAARARESMTTHSGRLLTTIAAAASLAAAGPDLASAQPIPLGAEIDINEITSGEQTAPSAALLDSGDFVVVWQSAGGHDGDGDGIFGRLLDSSGVAIGPQFQVDTYTTDLQIGGQIAVSSSDELTIVWTSDEQDGDDDGIFARRYDSAGSAIGVEFQVNEYTTAQQRGPHVAVSPLDGALTFVWQSIGPDGDLEGVAARRFDSVGGALGCESAATGKSTLQIRKRGGDRNRLTWKLKGGTSTTPRRFLSLRRACSSPPAATAR